MSSLSFTTSTIKTIQYGLKKSARFVSGVFFAVILYGCASTPQTRHLLSQPPLDIPQQYELSETPFFPQEEYQCGPAALATVLAQQKVSVTPEQLLDKVYIPGRQGSLQIEMIATARSYGLLTYQLDGNLSSLLKEVAAGRTVLIFQNLGLQWIPRWHYAVVVGYDLNAQQLILRSGTEKRHLVSFSTFEQTWARAQYWAYLLLQPGQIPLTANSLNYTRAANNLMKAGFEHAAITSFQSAARFWSQQALPHMALGNAEYGVADYAAAEQAFRNAIEVEPDNAQAWNNLAYTYVARNCRIAAIKAIGCAVRLSPDDSNLSASMTEIVGKRTTPAGQCAVPRCPRYHY